MSTRRLLVLAGHPGDGKTAVANYLSTQYGITTYEFGQTIRDEAMSRGLELSSRTAAMSFLRNTLDIEYRIWTTRISRAYHPLGQRPCCFGAPTDA